MQYISFCRYKLSALSQYFIWLGVNHLLLCDYPYSRLHAGVYKRNIDTMSLLSTLMVYHC